MRIPAAQETSTKGQARRPRRRAATSQWALVVVLCLFLVLGVVYSVVTPLFETPDEPWHYRYVRYLADHRRLPPLLVRVEDLSPVEASLLAGENRDWIQGEAHQPPLFYVIGALLTHRIDKSSLDQLYERNPYAALGRPDSPANKNAVLHNEAEGYPYSGVSLAVHLLRWFNLVCSAGTLFLVYRIAQDIAPRAPWIAHPSLLALGAAALTALNPQFLFISAGVNNDALVTLLVTWSVYLCVRVVGGHHQPYRTPLVLGLATGLAALTKLSGLAVFALVSLAYLLKLFDRSPRRVFADVIRPIAIATTMGLLIAGWWYVRNGVLYGDPFGSRAVDFAFSIRQESLGLGDVLRTMAESLISYWGVFGWMNILADEIYYTFVRVLCIMGAVGLFVLAAYIYWYRRSFRVREWRPLLLLLAWLLTTLTLLGYWTVRVTGPQGRLLFPAVSSISLLLFAGLTAWMPRHYGGFIAFSTVLVFLVVSSIAPFRYIAPAYARPTRLSLEKVPSSIQDLDVSFGDELFLLGYELGSDSVDLGDRLSIRLYWLARKRMSENYTFYLHVHGREQQRLGGIDTYPGGGSYPTSMWLPGEVVCEEYAIPIVDDGLVPVAASLCVGVYDRVSGEHLVALDALGRDIGHNPKIARVRVAAPGTPLFEPENSLGVNFGDQIMLVGYDFAQATDEGSEAWQITLYWRPLSWIATDYTVFLHLVDGKGQMVDQIDAQPLSGEYPTSYWQVAETVRDPYHFPLPEDLAAGDYGLHIGLYDLATSARLPVTKGEPGADCVMIGPVHVKGN